jgi:ribosomal protein S18 acetylase RimI-like enzyme
VVGGTLSAGRPDANAAADAGGVRAGVRLRRPTEADHARLVTVMDEWWGGRRVRHLLPRLWLRHFRGTSWIAEDPDGRLRGFLVGFVGGDDPLTGCVHLIATDPNVRRRGIGRSLYERAFVDLAAHGARRVMAVTWPGDRAAVAFHREMGFRVDDGPGTQPIYGTPAFPDYDGPGEDRVVLVREL